MSSTLNDLESEDGSRLIVRQSGKDTNGELLEMEAIYPPHSAIPPYHYHPNQAEEFTVLQGAFSVVISGVEETYEAGDTYSVPVNTPHLMHNISDEEGRLMWQVRPALKTQEFLETMWGLEADGEVGAQGVPSLMHLAVILPYYSDEFRPTSPPYWVQRIMFAILRPFGKIKGYKARYDKYSGPE